ncbi:UNVERIFIED_CONTAM: hypothetical protein NCL1_39848 [Trichonephila clavipes]
MLYLVSLRFRQKIGDGGSIADPYPCDMKKREKFARTEGTELNRRRDFVKRFGDTPQKVSLYFYLCRVKLRISFAILGLDTAYMLSAQRNIREVGHRSEAVSQVLKQLYLLLKGYQCFLTLSVFLMRREVRSMVVESSMDKAKLVRKLVHLST